MDLDTKSKNFKGSVAYKLICIFLSIIFAASSFGFLANIFSISSYYNADETILLQKNLKNMHYTSSGKFLSQITDDMLAVGITADRESIKKLNSYLNSQKETEIQKQLDKINTKKANKTKDFFTKVASGTYSNDELTNVSSYVKSNDDSTYIFDETEYFVPTTEIKHNVDVDESAPLIVRNVQKILNGTTDEDLKNYYKLASSVNSYYGEYDFDEYANVSYSVSYNGKKYGSTCSTDIQVNKSESDIKKNLASLYDSFVSDNSYEGDINTAKQNLDNLNEDKTSFKYYVFNSQTNEVLTNISSGATLDDAKALYEKNDVAIKSDDGSKKLTTKGIDNFYYQSSGDYYYNNSYDSYESIFQKDYITAYIVIDLTAGQNDSYNEIYNYSKSIENQNMFLQTLFVAIFAILAIACAVLELIACGKKEGYDGVKLVFIDYVPTEIHLFASGGIIFGIGVLISFIINSNTRTAYGGFTTFQILGATLLVALAWCVLLEFLTSFVRTCKSDKKCYKNLLIFMILKLIYKFIRFIIRKIKSAFSYKPQNFKRNIIIISVIYCIINLILLFFSAATGFAGFFIVLILIFNGFVVYKVIDYTIKLDKIIESAKTREELKINIEKLPSSLRTLAESFKYTNKELQDAVEKAVKDERLKTELITNVSHDLKTPLTSIITYVDLLSKCNIDDEKANEYIKVLDEKGEKLKRLIEDLIEASKLSSGNVTLNKTVINLNELVAQGVGEMQSDFEKNNLEVIFDEESSAPMIFADGSKTYRIIENLLVNAKKYSAPYTRVYAAAYEENGMSVFEIKNISSQRLNITPSELTDRFVRGDESRTKDGNGLGLSIAKELCTAQGGELQIIIDGDLFKARVLLPINK